MSATARGRALAALAMAAGALSPAHSHESDEGAPIRLAIVVVVDQMGARQLERLEPWLGGGLGRFAREGSVYCDAALAHGRTETAPGHACIGTALHPTHHGIVANQWFAPDGTGTYCVADAGVRAVTAEGESQDASFSPRSLRATGMADWLHEALPRSKAIAISAKDRSAIGMSGQHADVALWWDPSRGGFVTSTWYASELPAWVRDFDLHWVERILQGEFGGGWTSSLPAVFERSGTAPDEREGELGKRGERSFPHALPAHADPPSAKERARLAAWVFRSPAVDALTLELARTAMVEAELGADDDVDLLLVSLSACDTVGHLYGPTSCEVTDVLLRADRGLAQLFALADERAGSGRWIAALTADHGVLELPETLAERGVPAARISGKRISDTLRAARARVAAQFGLDFYAGGDARGIRLSLESLREAGADPAEVRREYARALVEEGPDWLAYAWTWDELRAIARDGVGALELARLEANSFDEARTSDVVLVARPDVLAGLAFGTTHGSPYGYDRAIPLAFLGPGFEAGAHGGPAASVDLAPTVFARLGLPVRTGLDGRVLAP